MLFRSPALDAQPTRGSNPSLAAPIATWDEAIPLGNGLLGGLVWGGDAHLNISLDRADLWDLRPAARYGTDGYRWSDVQRLVAERKEDSLHIRFDDPYDRIAYPTKLPGGRIVLTLDSTRSARCFALDLRRAEATVELTRGAVRGVFSATDSVALFTVPGLREVRIVRPASLNQLGYAPATLGGDGPDSLRFRWMEQRTIDGLRYVVAVGTRTRDTLTTIAITIATSGDGSAPLTIARGRRSEEHTSELQSH